MRKYKIQRSGKGFSVWVLKDFGGGKAWISCGKPYSTKFEAEKAAPDIVRQITLKKGGT